MLVSLYSMYSELLVNDGDTMNEQILTLLTTLKQSHNITILYACEAGSRAWSLHHEKSDYDVRFIYTHHVNQYISINEPKQVIEGKVLDSIEYSGWDIKKSLLLLKKHNPSILEWLHSPIQYINIYNVKEDLINLHRQHFHEKPLLHHYFNMARTNLKLLNKKPSTKLLLNVLRPLLMCKWIITYKEFPEVQFDALLSDLKLMGIKREIEVIIGRKKNNADELHQVVPTLKDWMNETLEYIKLYIDKLNEKSNVIHNDELDTLFRKIVKQ
ncbi:hypothetical protein FZW96_01560 [Bacillus sp. BGMRC 2118]|nr:hypothetical protein FZW96_01560 [Bacillus sp. BGMRC 2118]